MINCNQKQSSVMWGLLCTQAEGDASLTCANVANVI